MSTSILSIDNEALSATEHGAAWLIGHLANSTTNLSELDPGSSLVAEAVAIGMEAAMTHGVKAPVNPKGGQLVLAAAVDLATMMTHTAGTLPATPEEEEQTPKPRQPAPRMPAPPPVAVAPAPPPPPPPPQAKADAKK